jgi:hypothetical protein
MHALAQPRSDIAPKKTSHIHMNIHEPLPHAAAVYVDFNQDFMHSRTGSIGMAVLVPCRFQSRFLACKNKRSDSNVLGGASSDSTTRCQ